MRNSGFKSNNTIPLFLKKVLVTSILVVVFGSAINSCGCQKSAGKLPLLYEESDWQRMGLYGNVSSLTLYELDWEEAFGEIKVISSPVIDQSTNFNDKGNQVVSVYYDMNGQPKNKDVFVYDVDGETWLGCITYDYSIIRSDTLPQSGYTNFYDPEGRIYRIEGYDYDDSGEKLNPPSWVHLYTYLSQEGKIVRSSYDGKGALQWKNVIEYDSNGREIASIHYNSLGTLNWHDKFKYDNEGNKTEWSRYDSKGSIQWKDVLKYDENGNEIECANYDHRNILIWKDIYIYIDIGDIEGYDIINGFDVKNKFDTNGNWIIKVTLEEKTGFGGNYLNLKEIEQRAITYFP